MKFSTRRRLYNTLNPADIAQHGRVHARPGTALRKAVADYAVGHPARMMPIEIHERSAAIAGTGILRFLTAGAQLLGTQSHAVQIE